MLGYINLHRRMYEKNLLLNPQGKLTKKTIDEKVRESTSVRSCQWKLASVFAEPTINKYEVALFINASFSLVEYMSCYRKQGVTLPLQLTFFWPLAPQRFCQYIVMLDPRLGKREFVLVDAINSPELKSSIYSSG